MEGVEDELGIGEEGVVIVVVVVVVVEDEEEDDDDDEGIGFAEGS